MPWILLLLAALFTAPLSAATLPGVPTANTDKNSASEPDVEQKRAAYAALADVLANDSARQELIDQLRKAAATPPPTAKPRPMPVPSSMLSSGPASMLAKSISLASNMP